MLDSQGKAFEDIEIDHQGNVDEIELGSLRTSTLSHPSLLGVQKTCGE